MKKQLLFLFTVLLVMLLSGCFFIREAILAPPEEMEIPEGSKQAICLQNDIQYKYIYQLDGIYVFYIDDIIQDDDALNTEQEQAYLHGESVENYLFAEYGIDNCTITDYN